MQALAHYPPLLELSIDNIATSGHWVEITQLP